MAETIAAGIAAVCESTGTEHTRENDTVSRRRGSARNGHLKSQSLITLFFSSDPSSNWHFSAPEAFWISGQSRMCL
jgi:hypothetical protein